MTNVNKQLREQIDAFERMMYLKTVQGKDRMVKVAEFGEVGKKSDCEYCTKSECIILKELYCKSEVCHFYTKKGDS